MSNLITKLINVLSKNDSDKEVVLNSTNLETSIEDIEKVKIEIFVDEYKETWKELLNVREDIKKTFIYSAALGSIGATILRNVSQQPNLENLQVISLIGSIIFSVLGLNYVASMRHHQFLLIHMETLSKEVKRILRISDNNLPVLEWANFTKRKYLGKWSLFVFFFTWGSQPFFPLFFAPIAIIYTLLIDAKSFLERLWQGFDQWYVTALIITALIIYLIFILSFITALIELFKYMYLIENNEK